MLNYCEKTTYPKYALNKQHTVATIHQAILENDSPAKAAKQLNLGDMSTLNVHLGKFILDDQILSFDRFKLISVERAQQIWGEDYHQTLMAPHISINDYAVAHIHDVACHSKNIRQAGNKLGIRDHSIQRFLSQYSYKGNLLTFKMFQSLIKDELIAIFKEKYFSHPPEPRKNLTPDISPRSMSSDELMEEEFDFKDYDLLNAQDGTQDIFEGLQHHSFFYPGKEPDEDVLSDIEDIGMEIEFNV